MGMTNQEKQERFRKKEYLKKIADDIFRDWQSRGLLDCTKDHKSVRSELDRIIDLPSGWRDDDYQHAINSLNTIVRELYSNNPYLLQNDIMQYTNYLCERRKNIRGDTGSSLRTTIFAHCSYYL
jgi:hypothetical protein